MLKHTSLLPDTRFVVHVVCAVFVMAPGSMWTQGKAQTAPELTRVWVRVADSSGAEDEDNGTASVESAEFSPDEMLVATSAKRSKEVSLWRVDDAANVWTTTFDAEVEAVTFTRDGQYVVAGGEDHTVRVLRVENGDVVQVLDHVVSVEGLRFSHRGDLLATGNEAGEVNVWDTSGSDPANWPTTPRYTVRQGADQDDPSGGPSGRHADVNQVDWTEDDRYVVSAGRNQSVKMWEVARMDASDGGLVRTFEGHRGSVKSVRLSPGDSLVAAGAGSASGVRVWEVATGALATHIEATGMIMETVAWTPDGAFLVTGGNEGEGAIGAPVENPGFENNDGFGHIRFYRVAARDGEAFALALEHPVFRQEYLQMTQDGKRMLSAHEDGTVRLWQVTTGQATGTKTGELVPDVFRLRGAYPNPFDSTTTVAFDLTRSAEVRVEVADLLGQTVLEVPPRRVGAGTQLALHVDASSLASGAYFYRVSATSASETIVEAGTFVLLR